MDPKTQQGTRRGSAIILCVWEIVHEIWMCRCKGLHDQDVRGHTQSEINDARARAWAMYSYEQELLPDDQLLFNQPKKERLLKGNTANLVNWVNSNWDVVQRMVSDAQTALKRNAQDI